MGNHEVPRYPVSISYEEKGYGKDPCKSENECDPNYKAVINYKKKCEGTASYHGYSGANFRVSLVGVEKCSRYLFLAFNSAGTFVENGSAETSFVHGKTSLLKSEGLYNDCKWKWEDIDSKEMLGADIAPQEISISTSAGKDGKWTGSDGNYRRFEQTDEGDGVIYSVDEEMMLMRIDTGAIFRYIIQKPGVQTISASGYHNKTSGDGTKKTIRKIKYSAELTLGRKPPFTIIAENVNEYKAWLPGHPDYSGTCKPLIIKAKFEEGKQQDSIKFEIINASHLPGICINYFI